MPARPNSLAARDGAFHFHGYTNALKNEQEGGFVVVRGDGPFIYTEDGKEYFDGLSGLWCSALGFGPQPRLVEAARRQMETLPYYHTFTQKAPGPAVELAEKLVALAPEQMTRAYFCNSGSEANDTAIKIVWYFNNALGRPAKKKLIAREKAYHGVTVAAGSLTGLPAIHGDFDLPVSGILRTDCPHHYRFGTAGESEVDFASRCAENLEKLILAEGPDTIAAMFAEPVQGAGGVIIPPATYWAKVMPILKKYDILLVADEVICGFGRTGNWWGSETFGLEPDIITTAKQLSAGQAPIAAVLMSQRVYEVLRDHSSRLGSFAHGFTYSGHPLASAVALETLRIYEELDIVNRVRDLAPVFAREMQSFAGHPLVGEVRHVGLVGAIELVRDKASHASFDPKLAIGPNLVRMGHDHGLIVRPVLDSICFCPPLICTEAQIVDMFQRFGRALADTQDWLTREGHA